MSVDPKSLEDKLRELHPEIGRHGLNLALAFDSNKDAWIVTLQKDEHKLSTHLERKDAEACLEGVQCVYLGVQIAQFIKNFETGS